MPCAPPGTPASAQQLDLKTHDHQPFLCIKRNMLPGEGSKAPKGGGGGGVNFQFPLWERSGCFKE